jgi:hypothetical protein
VTDSDDVSTLTFPEGIRVSCLEAANLCSQTELWTRDELLLVVKYELFKRNKAALTLFWDLDARNHEVTLLKIKHIQLKDRYGEGEIPNEAKTGTGPILLTSSFPYVRDWLNEHPFKNAPEARLICNLRTGGPVRPEAMWTEKENNPLIT